MIRRMNYIIRTALAGLLVGLAFSASSLTLTFSGQISQYGFPVPNKTVSYDLNGAPYSSVVSDSLGFFSFNIIDSLLSGNVNVSIVDCQQFQVNQSFIYDSNTTQFNNILFNYCSDSLLYVQGNIQSQGLPSPGAILEFSVDGFRNVLDSTFTNSLGNFSLPLYISNQLAGFLHYRYTDCNQQLIEKDSIYFQLGDTVSINIEACPLIDTTSVTGSMFSSNAYPVTNYQVQLIALDSSLSNMYLKDQSSSSASGGFAFPNVDEDFYLLRCVPLQNIVSADSVAPPSYFGGGIFWSTSPALFLTPGQRLAPWALNEIGPSFGPGQISGRVDVHADLDLGLGRSPIYLLNDSDSSIVSYAVQDTEGNYSFKDIAVGNYLVYLDYPGLPTDAAKVSLRLGNTDFDIDIYANLGGVSYGSFLGLEEERSEIRVYPNPAHDLINLELPFNEGVLVHSQLGQEVFSQTTETTDFKIDVREWNSGIYRLSFMETSGKRHSIKILKL